MIAIASGLLGNLETVATPPGKKSGPSSGFAAAFEEVSAKDAAVSGGGKAQGALVGQGRRVAGGGRNQGRAGIVAGKSGGAAVSIQKAQGAKAAGGDVAANLVAEGNGLPDAGEDVIRTGPGPSLGQKSASVREVGAVASSEVGAPGEEAAAGGEALVSGASVSEGAVPTGVSAGSVKVLKSPGSASGALPGGSARVRSQDEKTSDAAHVTLGTSTVLPVSAAIVPQLACGGREGLAAPSALSTEQVPVAVRAPSPPVVAAGPALSGPGGTSAREARPSLGSLAEEEILAGGPGPANGTDPAATVAAAGAAAVAATGAATVAAGHAGRVASGSVAVLPRAQEGSVDLPASTAKPEVRRSVLAAPVQPGVETSPVLPTEVSGTIGSHRVNGQPSSPTVVAASQGTVLQQPAIPSVNVAGRAEPVVESVPTSGVAHEAEGPGRIIPQPGTQPAALAQSADGSQVAPRQTAGQTIDARQTGVQQVAAAPESADVLVDAQTAGVARGFDAHVVSTRQVAATSTELQHTEGKQTVQQIQPSGGEALQTEVKPIQAAQAAEPQAGAPPTAPRLDNPQGKAVERKTDQGAGRLEGAVQQTGRSADTDKDEKAAGVAAAGSDFGKSIAGSNADGSTDASPRFAPAAANASEPVVPSLVPLVSATPRSPSTGVSTVAAVQAALPEGGAKTNGVSGAHELAEPVAAFPATEVAVPQAARVTAGPAAAPRERRPVVVEGKTLEKTLIESASLVQAVVAPHLQATGTAIEKPPTGSHQTQADTGTPSLATGTAGLGGGIGAVPLSATQVAAQVATHGIVAPNIAATNAASGTQSPGPGGAAGGLTSPGAGGMETLLSPIVHTTLQATPTVLEVGVPGGTHGWLKIRAEIGEGGTVQASMSAATHEGQETLRRELPALNAFLGSEHVPVSVQVATHGLSMANSGAIASAGVPGGETGLTPGSGFSQDAEQGRNEAGSGQTASGDGARQGSGDGSRDSYRATTESASANGRGEVSAEADWVSRANADAGSGYGSGTQVNGGSWLNVIA